MSRRKSIEVALQVAQQRRDAAAQRLAQAVRIEHASHVQADQLRDYALEKESGWLERARVHGGPEIMRHHYAFMGKLDEAITFQGAVITEKGQLVQQARLALQQADQWLLTLQALERQAENTHAVKQRRREQSASDEIAQQQTMHRLSYPSPEESS